MAKKILYKNHCTPQEQVSEDGRYYLDSDCGRKLTGSYLLELDSDITATGTITASAVIGTAVDFISVKATSIVGDALVEISLDGGTATVVKLLEGECFSSKIADSASPYVKITDNTGSASVEYMTGK
tara:strand:- start:806 stop:1186 length:381 start_codon:yes stop_codon:yes gene_type:complete